jgi:2,5-diketo-D-gluconate reductase B
MMKAPNTITPMPVIERDGGKLPVLGLGTFQSHLDACRRAVKDGLLLGYRHVDTARLYGNEREVGRGIKDSGIPREEIFITTKLETGRLDETGVRASCDASLRDLDVDEVNLLLIHWPQFDVPLTETLGAMARLKADGKIRHYGVSNFTTALMNDAEKAAPGVVFCNQVEYHPYLYQGPVLEDCRRRGIPLVAYSPLARGKVAADTRLSPIAAKHGKTPAQISLRWIISQSGCVAIPKGVTETHLRENLDIFDFELDGDDLAVIDSLEKDRRQISPSGAPAWDT